MKKLFLLAAALVGLAACNEDTEYGPEYTTAPELGEITYVGEDSGTTTITADEAVDVSCEVTSKYGLHSVWIVFMLNDEPQSAAKASVWENPSPNSPNFTKNYSGKIPAQKAGTKVSFQLVAYSPYGVGIFSYAKDYTVLAAEPAPEE